MGICHTKTLRYRYVFISVLEGPKKYTLSHFLTPVMSDKIKKGGCIARPSLCFGLLCTNDLDFELKPVSIQFLQVSPGYVAILCTHGHRFHFPVLEHIELLPTNSRTEAGFFYDLSLSCRQKMLTETVNSPLRRVRFARTCASNRNKCRREGGMKNNSTGSRIRTAKSGWLHTYVQSWLAPDNTQMTRRCSCCVLRLFFCAYQLMV